MHEDESGRVHRRGLGADAGRARRRRRSILGHSERRQFFGETDEALAQKVPAALAAGLEPILCVGETEEERDGGADRGSAERQLRADLAEVSDEDIAERRDRLRADLGDRYRQGRRRPSRRRRRAPFIRDVLRARSRRRPTTCGSSTAARSSPRTPPSSSRSPTSTAPWSAAPALDAGRLRRDRRGGVGVTLPVLAARSPSLRPRHPRRLGARAGRSGQRGLARRRPPSSTTLWARYPHTQLSAQGHDVGLPDRPDGQLRGRPPQPRRRRDRQAGPGPHRRRDRRRLASTTTRRSSPPARGRAKPARARCTCSAWSPTAASTRAGSTSRRSIELAVPARGAGPRLPRLHRRPRHAADGGARVPRRAGELAARRGPDRDRRAAATTRWTATRRWERVKLAYDAIVHAQGQQAASAAAAIQASYERRRNRRVRAADRDRRLRRRRRPATSRSSSTSGPTGPAR